MVISAFNCLCGFSFVFCLRSTIISSDVEVETRTVENCQHSTVCTKLLVSFFLYFESKWLDAFQI